MRRVLLSFFLILLCGISFAQTQLTDTQSQDVTSQLVQTASSMQTMQCRFVQQTTSSMLAEPSVSEGMMTYMAPDKMRWEYTTPYSFALIVNGEKIMKMTEGQIETFDAKQGRMYKSIADIIMSCASGKKLLDDSMFDITLFDDGKIWRAEMKPLRKDMKRMFSLLTFCFDKKTAVIAVVEMTDAEGNLTQIQFEEKKVNEEIDVQLFTK